MTQSDITQTPTPQVDEGTPVKSKSVKRKTVAKKSQPRTLASMARQIQRDATKAAKAAKPRATHNYKIPVEPDVAKTLSALSAMSGYPIRYLHRIALANLISVYAPYYGLENWAAPEVRLPPPPLPTAAPVVAPEPFVYQPPQPNPYQPPHPQQPYTNPNVPHVLPNPPMWKPNPQWPDPLAKTWLNSEQQSLHQQPFPAPPTPPLQQPQLTPYQSEYGEIDGIPSETVPFRL